MMVPRSYTYSASSSNSSSDENKGPCTMRLKGAAKKVEPSVSSSLHMKPKRLCSAPAATPSKPVIIPTRTNPPKSRRNGAAASGKENINPQHNPNAMSPSMAALLAVTSIPQPRALTIRRHGGSRRAAIEKLSPDDFRHSLSSSSPKSWSILQSPPNDIYGEGETNNDSETDLWSINSESTVAPLSSYRSLSSDSMPSLDGELDFDSPRSVGLHTPSFRVRVQLRREKLQARVTALSCDEDHPLSPAVDEDGLPPVPTTNDKVTDEALTSSPKGASQFKSNLTASLRLLRSAAKSFASSATPKVYAPTLLSRSPPLNIDPTYRQLGSFPKQRPGTTILSANNDNLPFLLSSPILAPPATSSIQLTTYTASSLPSTSTATAPPVFLPPANPPLSELYPDSKGSTQRPREPRENSNFLRMVVLEMNMRRAGKLKDEGGRARIWLGPRAESMEEEILNEERSVVMTPDEGTPTRKAKAVPKRWVGELAE